MNLDNKFFRRIVLVWSIILITWVTYKIFTNPPDIPSSTVTAFSIVVGILATVIGFYKWSRFKQEKDKSNPQEDQDHV